VSLDDLSYQLADATTVVGAAWARGWTLPEPLTVSEWADRHRLLTREGAAEPGPWDTARTPYLREVMDVLSDEHPAKKVVLMKPTQVGGTECLNNFAGYIVQHSPGPTMVVQPTEKLAQRWSRQRLAPMIAASPALRGLISAARARDGSNTTLLKEFPGGLLVIAGANSSADLRSMPARRILADEVDEYPADLDEQGEPLELAERRASTFIRRKVFVVSSPKIKSTSVVWREYEKSDQRQFHVPCPHCGHRQVLVIDQLTDDGKYLCKPCGTLIDEHHKTAMLSAGEWVPGNPSSDIPGFHLNALYAPLGLGYTWSEIAAMRAEAVADPTKQVTFTNTILGLPFEGERQQQDASELRLRAEVGFHRRMLPRGVLLLTIGVDCQHDRFAICVVGWGRNERAWIVDYEEIPGDPSQQSGYEDLDAWLQQLYATNSGIPICGQVVAIDGGNWTEEVAKFVRTRQRRWLKCGDRLVEQRLFIVRGRSVKKSERVVYRPAKSETNDRGKTIARSVGVWGVGTDVAKSILFGRMASDGVIQADARNSGLDPRERADEYMIHFPGGDGREPDPLKPDPGALPESYYKGLTSEYFDLAAQKWVKVTGVRNEPLDTLVYAYWAALCPAMRIDLKREHEWKVLEAQLEPPADLFSAASNVSREAIGGAANPNASRETPKASRTASSTNPPHRPRRSGWVDPSE
jgi:phage terminase large subunit GpA-like protein